MCVCVGIVLFAAQISPQVPNGSAFARSMTESHNENERGCPVFATVQFLWFFFLPFFLLLSFYHCIECAVRTPMFLLRLLCIHTVEVVVAQKATYTENR